MVMTAFFGCELLDDDNTSHPNEGGVNLEVDWSNTANQPTSAYRARAISPSGSIRDFGNLTGTNNLLVVPPGDVVLYVFNDAEHVSVFGKKVTINNTQTPGPFYSYSSSVFTERDKDINHTAEMIQQTGELKISLAIKPASMLGKVKSISAVLNGVYTEWRKYHFNGRWLHHQ